MKIPLREIDPKAAYDVEIRAGFEKVQVKRMSGLDLASLEIAIPDKPGSVVVFYRRR